MNRTRLDDRGIKSAKPPPRRRSIARLYVLIIYRLTDSRPVHRDGLAGRAKPRELDHHPANLPALPGPQDSTVDALGGEILPQRACGERKAGGGELAQPFGSNPQQRFVGTSMNAGVIVKVAFDAEGRDDGFRDGMLGDAAQGNADLLKGTWHCPYCKARAAEPSKCLDVVVQSELVGMRP